MYRSWGLVFALVLAGSAVGAPLSLSGEKECWKVWKARGFAAKEQSGRGYLFDIGGKETYSDFYQRLDRSDCWKKWLLVIYMAADNDLSPYSFRDIWEMESVGSTSSFDIVVFQDSAKDDGLHYYHLARRQRPLDYQKMLRQFVKREGLEKDDPKTQEEFFLEHEGKALIQSPEARETLPEGDSGDPRVAGQFVRWALGRYPSERLAVIGWSHGQGFDAGSKTAWRNQGGRQGGFAFDFTSKSHMAVTEMAEGLKDILNEMRGGHTVEIAGSDACLNQQVEFGFEWIGVADYVFGSSTIVQKKGFNYRMLLDYLVDHPATETRTLAEEIPVIYGRSVSEKGRSVYSSYHDPNATMGTWATPALIPLKRNMNQLGESLQRWVMAPEKRGERAERVGVLRELISTVVRFGSVSYDLYNFLQSLEVWARAEREKDPAGPVFWDGLLKNIASTHSALTASVASSYIGKAYEKGLVRTSKGVAVWLPSDRAEFQEMYPKFLKAKFYASEEKPGAPTEWAKFVNLLYGSL